MRGKVFVFIVAVGVAACILAGMSRAVPRLINYQGRLLDSGGQPVDALVPMGFKLLDGDTAGSAVLWGETQSPVAVSQGIYHVVLGSVVPIPDAVFDNDVLYLEVAVGDETLNPRQRLTATAYSMRSVSSANADQLDGLDSTAFALTTHDHNDLYYTKAEVEALVASLQSQIDALQSQVDTNTTDIASNTGDIASNAADITANHADIVSNAADIATNTADISTNTSAISSNASAISTNTTDIATNASDIVDLDARVTVLEGSTGGGGGDYEARVSALETKLASVSVVGTDFIFTGVNINITNGAGNTDTANGLGNLVIGYNEVSPHGNTRTGSHNLVVGEQHTYSSFGGLVAGYSNSITGQYASIVGGENNTASGDFCAVLGGNSSTASGAFAVIGGGRSNTASGDGSQVAGGRYNIASGDYSSVAGGGGLVSTDGNVAFSHYSAVLGGKSNNTGNGSNPNSGLASTVSGGDSNRASGTNSVVSGGSSNTASNTNSSVAGGINNQATGTYTSIAGGYNNSAAGPYSTVAGGENNSVSVAARSGAVSGGLSRSVAGAYDWRAGTLLENQ